MSNTRIELRVKGLRHVPSFKNTKRAIIDGNTGRLRTLTPRITKQWMKRCEDAFVSQLESLYQTNEAAMPTARSRQSWIACVAPFDDSVNHIREILLTVADVEKGKEGAVILIEPI